MLDCASKTFGIQFAAGQVFLLHARFNCCKDDVVPGTTDKFRRIGLGSQELQMKWLQVKGEHNGFKAIDIGAVDEGTFTSPVRKDLKFRSVLFHGLIQVTDPDAFDRAFLSGIGHGKGFGFGMLSVVAVHPK
jgi:CRISPR system Cascade subunit CasE